jgi:hypothetical protein
MAEIRSCDPTCKFGQVSERPLQPLDGEAVPKR